MIDASCDKNDLIQVIDIDKKKYMISDSLTSFFLTQTIMDHYL